MAKPKVAFYWCASCGGCEEAVLDLGRRPTYGSRSSGYYSLAGCHVF